jgi:hypothetical protein
MKIYFSFILFLCLANTVFAQRYFFDTSFINNKQKFTVKTKEIEMGDVLLTIFHNAKKIMSDTLDSGGLMDLDIIDFNKDKSMDIMLTYVGNNATYYLYLFDNKSNRFRKVKDFDKFPEAIQLTSNAKYYYSYHRAGCADMNWVSDLFSIENFKAIQKGHIYAQGCDYKIESNPQIIGIYKIVGNNENNKRVINKLPMMKYVSRFGDKWEFIAKYWNKNYLKFL